MAPVPDRVALYPSDCWSPFAAAPRKPTWLAHPMSYRADMLDRMNKALTHRLSKRPVPTQPVVHRVLRQSRSWLKL